MKTSTWITRDGYQEINGEQCSITLEPRPHYCDRGNWIAKLFSSDTFALEIDWCDGWPRYYFDEERAKQEVLAWLKKRQQLIK